MRSNVQLCDATTSNQKQLTSITSNQARQGMDSSTWIPKLLQTVTYYGVKNIQPNEI